MRDTLGNLFIVIGLLLVGYGLGGLTDFAQNHNKQQSIEQEKLELERDLIESTSREIEITKNLLSCNAKIGEMGQMLAQALMENASCKIQVIDLTLKLEKK